MFSMREAELRIACFCQRKLVKVLVTEIGGDYGYSENDNIMLCKENKLETSSIQKDRIVKNEIKNIYQRELARVIAISMECSFGT